MKNSRLRTIITIVDLLELATSKGCESRENKPQNHDIVTDLCFTPQIFTLS